MRTSAHPAAAGGRTQRGFSLVEVLIGLLIAMIGVVIMMEVMITSEERSRTTSSGNDAMSNGAIMMHMMQRDLVQAGYGINTLGLLGCTLTLPNGKDVPMVPVAINPDVAVVPAGDPNTDRLLVFYGSNSGQPEGNTVYKPDGTKYQVQAPTAFAKDDYVVRFPGSCGTPLKLAKVASIDLVEANVVLDAAVADTNALYNLGARPRVVAYAVRNGALSTCAYMNESGNAVDCTKLDNWSAVGGNIVSMRAQYGKDTTAPAMDGTVDAWEQASPAAGNSCAWVRASTVRYALVARSSQYETKIDAAGQRTCEQITTAAPPWNGAATTAIDLSSAADWQCYRYRTFENVAPSRNIVWMGAQAGC